MAEQMNLEGFEPSENDLMEMAMRQPLDIKISKAMKLLQEFEETAIDLSDQGYYLAFSGGKDSIVIKQLAKMAGVKFESYYNNVTIDPPELVRFIKKEHSEVKWNNPKMHLCKRIVERRDPPTRLNRWCCAEYKEKGGDGKFKVVGIRAAESARRKGLWKQVVKNKRMGMILCPILYWTDEDVWQFIRDQKMEYCCLYDEGFKRLGCIGCPLGGPKNQKREFERWPRYEALWKKAFKDLWEGYKDEPNRKGEPRFFAKYKSWQDFWEWWISGKGQGAETDMCQGSFMFNNKEYNN